jgi:RNA-binding protein Luc7-like 2
LNKVHELAEQIGKKLAAAEKAGAEGNVEESLKLMEEVEKTKKEKIAAEVEYRNSMPASSYQQQKLRVCEVCSAYLGIHDNDRRLADHFGGKLHLGFINIRERLEDLRVIVNEKKSRGAFDDREEDDNDRRPNRYNRNRDRYDDRRRGDERRPARRSRSRSRDKDRNQGNQRRRRSRSPTHSRQRSRSRSRERRDRNRDNIRISTER